MSSLDNMLTLFKTSLPPKSMLSKTPQKLFRSDCIRLSRLCLRRGLPAPARVLARTPRPLGRSSSPPLASHLPNTSWAYSSWSSASSARTANGWIRNWEEGLRWFPNRANKNFLHQIVMDNYCKYVKYLQFHSILPAFYILYSSIFRIYIV